MCKSENTFEKKLPEKKMLLGALLEKSSLDKGFPDQWVRPGS